MELKIFKISQNENNGYDTYSDAIVVAESEDEAKHSCICGWHKYHDGHLYFQYSSGKEKVEDSCSGWANAEHVQVELIGNAMEGIEKGVVCSSFHAG